MPWLLLLLLPLGLAQDADDPDPDRGDAPLALSAPGPSSGTVAYNYDGDTLTLTTGERVRVRGVNTPEIRPAEEYGVEARDAAARFVAGKRVELRYGATVRDGYGRLVAEVYADGKSLAEHLIELGLGHVFLIPPDDTDAAPLLAAQDRARAARRGIWSTERYQGVLHITSFHANADGDDRVNVNGEYLRICNVSSAPVDLAGFRIADVSGNSWELPSLLVPPGHTFKLHAGQGTHQADPTRQLAVYLQSPTPIWNNRADRATIYDRYGRVVDSRVHEVQSDRP